MFYQKERKMLVSVCLLGIVLLVNCSYNCDNKEIKVNGRTNSLIKPFLSSMFTSYRTYRSSLGLNVKFLLPSTAEITVNTPMLFDGTRANRTVNKDFEIQFPLMAQAIVLIYNLPGIDNLNLSIKAIANIYNGKIKYWNDTVIRKYNPQAKLPYETILPVARAETDASTILFTQVLSAIVPTWNNTYGIISSPLFTGGTCCAKGGACCQSAAWNSDAIAMYATQVVGMVGVITSFKYTIGYATMDTVSLYTVNIVNIMDSNDTTIVTQPTTESIQMAMYNYINKSETDDLNIELQYALTGSAYPFTAFSYMIINVTYDTVVDCCAVQELVGFVDWIMFNSDDFTMLSKGYVPLIDQLQENLREKVLKIIRCSDGFVYDNYLVSKLLEKEMENWKIILIAAVGLFLLTCAIISAYIFYNRRFYTDESRWLIQTNRIKLVSQSTTGGRLKSSKDNDSAVMSLKSVETGNKTVSNESNQLGMIRKLKTFMVDAELDDNRVYLNKLQCKLPQQWRRITKRKMIQMRNVIHKNVCTMYGITVLDSIPYSVVEYVPKGTLNYFLGTCRYELNEAIKFQFALNVVQGLKYLHQHGIVHGFLNSINCYLDSTWTVKIASWGTLAVLRNENAQRLSAETTYVANAELDEAKLIELLYVDPTVISNSGRPNIDIFSAGLLLLEIFSEKLPYAAEIDKQTESYVDILSMKFNRNIVARPVRPLDMPEKVYKIALSCLFAEERRPDISTVCTQLNSCVKIDKGLIDIIMETLESYAEGLEEKINERTGELKQVTDKMRHLLNEVLPQNIAEKLLAGEPIMPEQFECVTIYFSDIVGFTNISAKSTPNEVMGLLNDLWIAFDAVIDKFDVYKVDTIGDAYMVCSGLPVRNGMEHCKQIAQLALELLETCNRFKIKHLPSEQLKIRIGINSGPVTAGVVGSKMPQYCVFGDAVNTAARMESTSLPQKIQLSERSYLLLNECFPKLFEMEFRGETDVKGKGDMKTYWLLSAYHKLSSNLFS